MTFPSLCQNCLHELKFGSYLVFRRFMIQRSHLVCSWLISISYWLVIGKGENYIYIFFGILVFPFGLPNYPCIGIEISLLFFPQNICVSPLIHNRPFSLLYFSHDLAPKLNLKSHVSLTWHQIALVVVLWKTFQKRNLSFRAYVL